ncbi:MAG: LysM peptidoglycan-binding domain-containing protein, partial [Chloroflexi bacterium]|nr:LysM peptidoglycan-binding domain-containing protein [Chloroflexota bacterium]
LGSYIAYSDGRGAPLGGTPARYGDWGNVESGAANLTGGYSFTAQRQAAGGLLYARNRFYDPLTATWLTPDPFPAEATEPGSLNRYSYVRGNPITRTDPLGLFDSDLEPSFDMGASGLDSGVWNSGAEPNFDMADEPISAANHAQEQQSSAIVHGTSGARCAMRCGMSYTVKRGDTLGRIAARFHVPWRWIAKANRGVIGANSRTVKRGQELVIPCDDSGLIVRPAARVFAYAAGTRPVATAARGGLKRGLYKVAAGDISVRINRQGFSIGHLEHGDHFYLKQVHNGWGYGFAYASGMCGWVPLRYTRGYTLTYEGKGRKVPDCPNPKFPAEGKGGWNSRRALFKTYATHISDCDPAGKRRHKCAGGSPSPVKLNRGVWTVYANYFDFAKNGRSPGLRDPIGQIEVTRNKGRFLIDGVGRRKIAGISWRYITKDVAARGKAVLIMIRLEGKGKGQGIWGFVDQSEATPRCLEYKESNADTCDG